MSYPRFQDPIRPVVKPPAADCSHSRLIENNQVQHATERVSEYILGALTAEGLRKRWRQISISETGERMDLLNRRLYGPISNGYQEPFGKKPRRKEIV